MAAIPIERVALAVEDDDLALRHRYGDASAFEEVYARHVQGVYNLAFRLCNDPDAAADWTQEIFLRIYRHLGKFHGNSSLKTWIYRVTTNYCRSRLACKRRSAPLSEEMERCLQDPRRGPEEQALAGDAERRVGAALARLPAVFAAAVILCDIEGLSYQEIAGVLRVRVGTVRSRIARGRERLRELLETEERVP